MSILIINLYELDLGKLFEIRADEIGNIEVSAFGSAGTCEINVRDAICNFQFAIASESVVDRDPAVCKSFRGTRTLKVFVQRGLG